MSELRWTPPTLTSERLILRALKESDAPAIYSYSQDPAVAQFTLWQPHQSVDDALKFIGDYVFDHYEEESPEAFGICLKNDPDRVIGTCGAWWSPKMHHCMEVGYAISRSHWNQGIATEAAAVVRDYCFQNFDVNRLQAHHHIENLASGRIMEKIGMRLEGTFREKIFSKGAFVSMVSYSILRREWEALQRSVDKN